MRAAPVSPGPEGDGKAIVSAAVANGREQSMKAGLRLFWPRHARRGWTKGDLPLRLAGTLPWVLRIHVVVLAVLGVGGLLFAVAPLVPTDEPLDALGGVLMATFGLFMAGISIGTISSIRRSISAVVSAAGIVVDKPSSGFWFGEVAGDATPGGDGQVITSVELVEVEREYDLIGGGFDFAVPVRRLALIFHGMQTPVAPGLTFAVTRAGRARAEIAGKFLANCFGAAFIDRKTER